MNNGPDRITLAMTGASGAQYGLRLLDCLVREEREVHFLISRLAPTAQDQHRARIMQRMGLGNKVVLATHPAQHTTVLQLVGHSAPSRVMVKALLIKRASRRCKRLSASSP